MWGEAIFMYAATFVLLGFFLMSEYFLNLNTLKLDKKLETDFVAGVEKKEQVNYFERISNVDRKRWIAEEHFMRKNYGINVVSDDTLGIL